MTAAQASAAAKAAQKEYRVHVLKRCRGGCAVGRFCQTERDLERQASAAWWRLSQAMGG